MDLSLRWLKDFVDFDFDKHEYFESVTLTGSKVEGFREEGSEISGVVVGKVESITPHPDSDHLVICQVNVGSEVLQIVTGASNLKVGDLVPVATNGSTLPGGIKIKKGKLRGVESFGMMCSLGELGLTRGDFPYAIEDGIFVLQEDCKLGQDIKEVIGLNDTVIEFEITSNRPDCLSVTGLARETANTYHVPFKEHTPVVESNHEKIEKYLSAKIEDNDLCNRYMARVVKNVKIGPSPRWMRERLRASGVRPINNIVDITNYVMLEYGQPMHAFDIRYVAGNEITIRRAKAGESIMTLDGEERELSNNMLVIADTEKPIAVAGVMGGEHSGIFDDTETIVFESANFYGGSVRTTAKALGMRTESSSRFEKGLSPVLCEYAIDRACELINMLDAGEVVGGTVDLGDYDKRPKTVKLDAEWTNKFLGTDIPHSEMVKILTDLGFGVKNDVITVPYFRVDINHKADVAEEIARIYGYDKIPSTGIKGVAESKLTDTQKYEKLINNTMLSLGYSQIITYSFISPKLYDKVNMPEDSEERKSLVISNPLGEDTSIMRTTALPSMLDRLAFNYKSRNDNISMFEIAKEYIPQGADELPIEQKKLVIGSYGNDVDFYSVKGAVEELLRQLDVKDYAVEACSDRYAYHPGRTAVIKKDGVEIAVIGEIHPQVAENFGFGVRVYAAQVNIESAYKLSDPEKTYHPLPKFPAVTRDLAIICDGELPVAKLENAIKSGAGELLERIKLFDVYSGKQIPDGKKSVAYSFTIRSNTGTLTDKQSEKIVGKVIEELKKLGAEIRS